MADRVDENGAAYAGSQLQTQLYVNKRTSELDDAIRAALPELVATTLKWRSPLAEDGYREYWDTAFLKRLGLDEHVDALKRFWPTGGPHWDALALVDLPGDSVPGVLLVEGKSYPNEMLKGSGTTAADGSRSRTLIEKSLAWTQGRVGISMNTAAWTGPLYQNANRLAHAYWLQSRGVRTWLVHLLFTGDPHEPTTDEEWEKALATADEGLGLNDVDIPLAAHVLLPAGTRADLVRVAE
jgi:hypothetical protein